MGRKRKGARALGPYHDVERGRWRVVQVDEAGARTSHFAETEAQANKLIVACQIDLGIEREHAVTAAEAVEQFIKEKMNSGAWGSRRTVERTGGDLRYFVEAAPDAAVRIINPAWLTAYLERIAGLALRSQSSRYAAVKEFLGWCVRKRLLEHHPDLHVEPALKPWLSRRARRKMGRGKTPLRNANEVAVYVTTALALPRRADRVAVCLPLLVGLRSGEVRHLQVADVDFGLGRLWIREIDDDEEITDEWDVKSNASRRTVELPPALRDDLGELCRDRPPVALVFPSNRNPSQAWERKWLNRRVKQVCKAAGVRVVCAHGLRDTWASFMAEHAGMSDGQIGNLMGHADNGVTARRHYIGAVVHDGCLPVALLPATETDGDHGKR